MHTWFVFFENINPNLPWLANCDCGTQGRFPDQASAQAYINLHIAGLPNQQAGTEGAEQVAPDPYAI